MLLSLLMDIFHGFDAHNNFGRYPTSATANKAGFAASQRWVSTQRLTDKYADSVDTSSAVFPEGLLYDIMMLCDVARQSAGRICFTLRASSVKGSSTLITAH